MKISTIFLHSIAIISLLIQVMGISKKQKQGQPTSLGVKILFILLTIAVWAGLYFGLVAES
jgi:cell shape-determining protein MreD